MDNTVLQKDDELSLAASAARTSTLTGTGKAIGPTGLVEAVVVVTSVTSTPTITLHVQESSDDGSVDTYADVAVSVAITAVGVYRVPFIATDKYVRAYVVHGDTDPITYEVFVQPKGA